MSFAEKLQNLRKANNMSQEKLAEELDVTRQSVSKWESGTTYPEMDKLLSICKIFKCSLEDLTNDEITTISVEDKKKTNITGLINNLLEIVKKTVYMIKSMTFKDIVVCFITMFFVGLVLLIFRIPFELIEDGFASMISGLNRPYFFTVMTGALNFILDTIYYILYVLLFGYIFKILYLDKYNQIMELEKEVKLEKTSNEKEVKIVQVHTGGNVIINALGSIVVFFIKMLVSMFDLFCVMMFVGFIIALVIVTIITTKGILYIGLVLGLIFSIVLTFDVIEFITEFIFNRKINYKRIFITFAAGLVGVGISIGIFTYEISKTTYIDGVPEKYKMNTISETIPFNENLETHFYNVTYVIDETMTDKVKIDVEYYSDFYTVDIDTETNVIGLYYTDKPGIQSLLIDEVLDNLADKKIYYYDGLYDKTMILTSSSKNLEKIKSNDGYIDDSYDINVCEQCDYSEYIEENARLQEKINDLEDENQGYKTKIEEYKSTLQGILNE